MKTPKIGNIAAKRKAQHIEKKYAKKFADRIQTKQIAQRVAKDVFIPMTRVTINNPEPLTQNSILKIIQEYSGKFLQRDSVWAPWSKGYRAK